MTFEVSAKTTEIEGISKLQNPPIFRKRYLCQGKESMRIKASVRRHFLLSCEVQPGTKMNPWVLSEHKSSSPYSVESTFHHTVIAQDPLVSRKQLPLNLPTLLQGREYPLGKSGLVSGKCPLQSPGY